MPHWQRPGLVFALLTSLPTLALEDFFCEIQEVLGASEFARRILTPPRPVGKPAWVTRTR